MQKMKAKDNKITLNEASADTVALVSIIIIIII